MLRRVVCASRSGETFSGVCADGGECGIEEKSYSFEKKRSKNPKIVALT